MQSLSVRPQLVALLTPFSRHLTAHGGIESEMLMPATRPTMAKRRVEGCILTGILACWDSELEGELGKATDENCQDVFARWGVSRYVKSTAIDSLERECELVIQTVPWCEFYFPSAQPSQVSLPSAEARRPFKPPCSSQLVLASCKLPIGEA